MDNKFTRLEGLRYCLKSDVEFFKDREQTEHKVLFKVEKKVDKPETYTCDSELVYVGPSMYHITHTYTGTEGWTHIRTFVIKSSRNLVDIYEYLCAYKPIPTWETFVDFVKECTTVQPWKTDSLVSG